MREFIAYIGWKLFLWGHKNDKDIVVELPQLAKGMNVTVRPPKKETVTMEN